MDGPFCTVGGHPALEARIGLPRVGVWHVNAILDVGEEPSGAVEVKFGSVTLKGQAKRVGTYEDAVRIRITGGAGGLAKTIPAKSYLNLPLRIPLQDLLAAAGEHLSATADQALLGTFVARWTTMSGPASSALGALLHDRDVAWRVLPDGTIWVGTEQWLPAVLEHEVLDEDEMTRRTIIYAEDPSLMPGTTFLDRHVSYVEHQFGETLRTEVWFE